MLSCELEKENLTQICHGREPLLGVVDTTFNSSLLHILLGFHKKKKKLCDLSIFHGLPTLVLSAACPSFFLFLIFILGNKTSSTTTKQSPLKKKRRRKKERLQLQYWSVGNRVPAGVVVGGTPLTRFDCLLWCLPLVAQLHSCVFGLLLSTTLSNLSIYTASRWIKYEKQVAMKSHFFFRFPSIFFLKNILFLELLLFLILYKGGCGGGDKRMLWKCPVGRTSRPLLIFVFRRGSKQINK